MNLAGASIASYEVLAALGMAVWWIGPGRRQAEGFPKVSPFHLAAEALTAVALVASAVLEFIGSPQPLLTVFALGMLLYATVNAIGLVRQRGRPVVFGLGVEAMVTALIVLCLSAGFVTLQ